MPNWKSVIALVIALAMLLPVASIFSSGQASAACANGLTAKWDRDMGNLGWGQIWTGPLDNCRVQRILVAEWGGPVVCMDTGGNVLWTFTTPTWYGYIRVADIDRDGVREIVDNCVDGHVYCLTPSGALKWSCATGAANLNWPVLGDINRDGRMEVLVGSWNGVVFLISSTGSILWTFSTPGAITAFAIRDIDRDGKMEAIVSDVPGTYILDQNGQQKWHDAGGSIALCNYLGHCAPDLIVSYGTTLGVFEAVQGQMTLMQTIALPYGMTMIGSQESGPSYAVYDVNNDGRYELIGIDPSNNVYIIDRNMNLLWSHNFGSLVHINFIADMNGDRYPEVILSSDLQSDCWLYVVDVHRNACQQFLLLSNPSLYTMASALPVYTGCVPDLFTISGSQSGGFFSGDGFARYYQNMHCWR